MPIFSFGQIQVIWCFDTVNAKSDLFVSAHCRQSKAEVRTAAAKVDGMTKMMQNIQEQMQRRVSDGILTESRRKYDPEKMLLVGYSFLILVQFPLFMFSILTS